MKYVGSGSKAIFLYDFIIYSHKICCGLLNRHLTEIVILSTHRIYHFISVLLVLLTNRSENSGSMELWVTKLDITSKHLYGKF